MQRVAIGAGEKSTGAPASLAGMILAMNGSGSPSGSGMHGLAPAPYISALNCGIWKLTETPKRRAVARSQSISAALSRVTTALRKKSSFAGAQLDGRHHPPPGARAALRVVRGLAAVDRDHDLVEVPHDLDLLRDEEAVGHHGRAHAETPALVDQLSEVVAQQRLAAEELDAHRAEPGELGEELPMHRRVESAGSFRSGSCSRRTGRCSRSGASTGRRTAARCR